MLPMAAPDGIRVNTITLAFTLVAGTVVFLRLFTRLVLTKGAGFEDALIALAMILSIALAVTTSEQVMHGLGTHADKLDDSEVSFVLKSFWASLWVYNLTLTVTKMSTLVQYLRIFPIPRFQYACYVLLCIVAACGAWGVFGNVFMCYPVSFFWERSLENGQCMNQYIIWFTTAGLNIGQDVIILLLPIPVIRTLQISASQKKGLVTMLALGTSVVAASVIRLYTLDTLANSTDVTFDNSDQATLSVVEANVGIVCTCLPAMRPLFAIMMPKYFSPAIQCTKEPTKDAERTKHIEHTRKASTYKQAHSHRSPPTQPYLHQASSKGSLSSKASLVSRPPTAISRPSTAAGPNSSKISLTSLPPTAAGSRRGSVSSRLQTPKLAAQSIHSRSGSVSRSHSANHSRSNSTSHIAMASIQYPTKSISHSRSASNLTISTSRTRGPFRGNLNPLRMSPVTPFGPPPAHRLSRLPESELLSPLTPSAFERRPSDSSLYIKRLSSWRMTRRSSVSSKPLPLTPFPVGVDKYTHIEQEEESER